MSKLLRYSIETDQTVLLSFSDDSNVRVPISRVPEYVAPNDLKKINKALMMRENFFKRHLPKFAIIFAAGGLLVAGSFRENNALNHLFQPSSKVSVAPSTEQDKKNVLTVASISQTPNPVTQQNSKITKSSSPIASVSASPQPQKHSRFNFRMPHLPKLLP